MPEKADEPIYDVEAFDPDKHDRTAFSCGLDRADNYLNFSAKKFQQGDFSRVFIATDGASQAVRGFYAINAHSIKVEDLPASFARGAPNHGLVPGAYISMIGVDKGLQSQGLGKILLADALKRIMKLSQDIGLKVVVLDVLNDGADALIRKRTDFYLRMGFKQLEAQPLRMYISLQTVRAAFES